VSCCESGHGFGRGRRFGNAGGECCDDRSCCGSGRGFRRRFMSAREERELLEGYRDELKRELEGLEERLKDLER